MGNMKKETVYRKNGIPLDDSELDQVSGGIEDVITSTERIDLGKHDCGANMYRIIEKGYLGPFEIEKTHVECEKCGWLSV